MKRLAIFLYFLIFPLGIFAQSNPDLGAWYMYFGNYRFQDSPWAIHGEAQYRNHNIIGDLEQLLLRTGLQYNLKNGAASFLAGYGSITTQSPGKINNGFHESRVYQEVILRHKVGRVGLMHRYRYEQRWVENSPFKTRFRYALFVNVPLNQPELHEAGSWYLQVYDELFINGEKLDGSVEFFDRNRLYAGLGYRFNPNLALQVGILDQSTDVGSKLQLQFSIFQQLYAKK